MGKFAEMLESIYSRAEKEVENRDVVLNLFEWLKEKGTYSNISLVDTGLGSTIQIEVEDIAVYIAEEKTLMSRYMKVFTYFNVKDSEDKDTYSEHIIDLNFLRNPEKTIVNYVISLVDEILEENKDVIASRERLKSMWGKYGAAERVGKDYTVNQINRVDNVCYLIKDNGKRFKIETDYKETSLYIFSDQAGWTKIYREPAYKVTDKMEVAEEKMLKSWDNCIEFLDTIIY